MLEPILEFINTNVAVAPYVIFGLLLLAGLNIPVSEDLMLFISAVLAHKHPEYFYQLYVGVFLGAYCSDLICFQLGRIFGPKLLETKFFSKMISKQRIEQIQTFYKKFGIATLLVGRFIPFGVRNGLFFAAGFGKMSKTKFYITDFIAALISCTVFFSLYYKFGESVVSKVRDGNLILISIVIIVLLSLALKHKLSSK